MDFANPAYLLALPLALAPLVLHLFYHRKRSTVLFSSLVFLVRKERYFAYRRHIQELLLMLCRISALVLCILAMARPYLKRLSFLGGARTEAVVILDDTMSMQRTAPGGKSAFELALRQAENLMNSLDREDSAALVFLSGRPGIDSTRDKQRVVEALRGSSPTGTAGNLTLAVGQAVEALRHSTGVNREMYLLTDMQKNMFPHRKIPISGLQNSRLFVVPMFGSSENASVSCDLHELSLKTPGSSVYIPFTIHNTSAEDRDFKAELLITGSSVQSKVLSVKGNSSASGNFLYVPERAGRVEGSISIDDSNVPLDNAAPFSFLVSDVVKVLMLMEENRVPSPFYYLRMAVEPQKGSYGIEFSEGSLGSIGAYDLKQYPLMILEAQNRISSQAAQKLLSYVREGGNIIAVPAPESGLDAMNGLTESSNGELPQFPVGFKDMSASGIQFRQGLSSMNEALQLDLLQWRKLAPLGSEAGRILAQCASMPVIAEVPLGEGRIIFLAFDLRRRCSNWTELKSFPIVMNTLVNYASGRKDRTARINCGDSLKLSENDISFTDSRGLSGTVKGNIFKETWLPGTVLFSSGSHEGAVITPPQRESILETLPLNEMPRAFDAPISILSTNEEPAIQIARLRRGTDLAGYALLMALALLVLEYVLGLQFAHSKNDTGGR